MFNLLAALAVLLLVGPLLLIGLAGLVLLAAVIVPTTPRRLKETFWCPWARRVVTVEFLVPQGAAHPAEVATCSAFPNSERITCKRLCRDAAEVRWGLSRGVFPRWALTAGGPVAWRPASK
ncbi:MAG: hypothetical protein HY726_22055 [Candidatus Rokubacteria bacterium]|nr:hypothetical protein [Candidatus Rokubacteria bacterium]